jgi:hypothetical protein
MQNLFITHLNFHPLSIICGMVGMPELIVFLLIIVGIVFGIRMIFKKKFKDVVHLKNGSIIHGKIVEQMPNVSVKIQTKDGNTSVFQNTEIEKIITGK